MRFGIALLLLLGCRNGGGCQPPTDPAPRVCSGQVVIDVDLHGKRTMGRLLCDDVCDDGTPCAEMMNEAKDRAWCGCPGQPEPTLCHLAKALHDGVWEPDCGDTCPIESDRCNLTTEETFPDAGYTITASCACDLRNDY